MHVVACARIAINQELEVSGSAGSLLERTAALITPQGVVIISSARLKPRVGGLFGTQNGGSLLGLPGFGTQSGLAGVHNPSNCGRRRPVVYHEWAADQFLRSARLQAGSKQGAYERNGFHGW